MYKKNKTRQEFSALCFVSLSQEHIANARANTKFEPSQNQCFRNWRISMKQNKRKHKKSLNFSIENEACQWRYEFWSIGWWKRLPNDNRFIRNTRELAHTICITPHSQIDHAIFPYFNFISFLNLCRLAEMKKKKNRKTNEKLARKPPAMQNGKSWCFGVKLCAKCSSPISMPANENNFVDFFHFQCIGFDVAGVHKFYRKNYNETLLVITA